jgi:hypothetical protein
MLDQIGLCFASPMKILKLPEGSAAGSGSYLFIDNERIEVYRSIDDLCCALLRTCTPASQWWRVATQAQALQLLFREPAERNVIVCVCQTRTGKLELGFRFV